MRIVVAGAGSIGCFVGGLLLRGGRDVVLLGRERIGRELEEHGLHLTDHGGLDVRVGSVPFAMDVRALADARLVLVTVKSGATAEMAAAIAGHAPPDAVVISLQNGVANAAVLRSALPGRNVLAGMVPFNVLHMGGGRFHRGTSGDIMIEDLVPGPAERLTVPGLPITADADMAAVLWGKLLLNLNNALNALSGLPLRAQLAERGWRCILAAQLEEALAALTAAGIRPRQLGPVPPRLMPVVLRLPTPLFRMVASRTLKIDPTARSSMWEDLHNHRATEVGELQGAIVTLAERHGLAAPVNARVLSLVRKAEATQTGSPQLIPPQVWRARQGSNLRPHA